MTTTTNLGLTQYAGTDTINFLTQYNTDLGKIDTTTGKLSNLTTASKTNLVSATNENVTNIGTLASLTTTNKTNLVSAVNENVTNIGTLASLTTTNKTNLVSAVNEINNNLALKANQTSLDSTNSNLTTQLNGKKVYCDTTSVTFVDNMGTLTHGSGFASATGYTLLFIPYGLIPISSINVNGSSTKLEVRNISGTALANYNGTISVKWIAVGI